MRPALAAAGAGGESSTQLHASEANVPFIEATRGCAGRVGVAVVSDGTLALLVVQHRVRQEPHIKRLYAARVVKMGWFEKLFVNSAGHSQRVAQHTERLVRLADPRPGQLLLDVGCGNGAAPVHLARTFALEVTGVDVDPAQIEAAQRRAERVERARFLVVDTTVLPFEDSEFDLVFTNKVTHHVRDWPRALGEMTRVLKPGGHLVYSDLVAPFGSRYPTRRGIDGFVQACRLEVVRLSGSPLHYTGVFRKPTP